MSDVSVLDVSVDPASMRCEYSCGPCETFGCFTGGPSLSTETCATCLSWKWRQDEQTAKEKINDTYRPLRGKVSNHAVEEALDKLDLLLERLYQGNIPKSIQLYGEIAGLMQIIRHGMLQLLGRKAGGKS